MSARPHVPTVRTTGSGAGEAVREGELRWLHGGVTSVGRQADVDFGRLLRSRRRCSSYPSPRSSASSCRSTRRACWPRSSTFLARRSGTCAPRPRARWSSPVGPRTASRQHRVTTRRSRPPDSTVNGPRRWSSRRPSTASPRPRTSERRSAPRTRLPRLPKRPGAGLPPITTPTAVPGRARRASHRATPSTGLVARRRSTDRP